MNEEITEGVKGDGDILGLFHEQSRSDCDTDIESDAAGFDCLRVDFNSVMMYRSNAWDKDASRPTLTRKDGSTWTGQCKDLLAGDRATVDKMYPPSLAARVNFVARSSHHLPN